MRILSITNFEIWFILRVPLGTLIPQAQQESQTLHILPVLIPGQGSA